MEAPSPGDERLRAGLEKPIYDGKRFSRTGAHKQKKFMATEIFLTVKNFSS
jgi:hypothetical protein